MARDLIDINVNLAERFVRRAFAGPWCRFLAGSRGFFAAYFWKRVAKLFNYDAGLFYQRQTAHSGDR
jgi:hypothetical protein